MTRKVKTVKPQSFVNMTPGELAEATREFEQEMVVDTFGEPTAKQKAQLERAKRKRGRPKVGKGVKVVSVSLEKSLLARTDRLAKRLALSRARLISRGLQALIDKEIEVEG